MRIGLTYDLQTDLADPRQAEFDPPRTIQALTEALTKLGHEVTQLGNAEQLCVRRAQLDGLDLVMNIAEGSHGRCREAWVPALLEQWGVPFVGSGSTAQALALDKAMAKRLAVAVGVRTPRWVVIEALGALEQEIPLQFPLIVKPRYEGSGIGIDQGAVVQDAESLWRRVRWMLDYLHQACLVEEFVSFGELTVFLIGNTPPTALPVIQRPLDPSSRLSSHVIGGGVSGGGICPVDLTRELETSAGRMAVAMCETLGCRDVARVDLRVDERLEPWFLEINPLPSFDPQGSVGLLAEYLGASYPELIGRVLDAACRRLGLREAATPAGVHG